MSSKEKTEVQENVLRELLVDEIRDLYHAENQLVKALPKMVKAAHDSELKKSLEDHLEQTRGHVERLDQSFQILGEKSRGKPCKGMMGLVEEGSEHIEEGKKKNENEADLSLIVAAQKVEHYEISGYGSVRTMAETLGQTDVADLLQQTENEEKKADELLTQASTRLLDKIDQSMEQPQ
jgi:ferritin-like metal-binding protein YciE